jgi:riboflavin biosynthesis pyrimidine reductase
VVVAGEHQVDATAAVAELAGLGFHNILTEGGPQLLGQFAAAGLLDELCLTTSPVLAGGQTGRILAAHAQLPASRLSLMHVLVDEDFVFSRYVRFAD